MHAVGQCRVGKAGQQRIPVGRHIWPAQLRADIQGDEVMHKLPHRVLGYALVNCAQPENRAQAGQCGMAGVEQAQLGLFKRGHVIDHRDANR